MSVVKFPGINLNDVPGMLRALADQMESSDYGKPVGFCYAFNTQDGDVFCNAFGPVSQLEAIGMFAMAGSMFQMMDYE